MRKSKLFKRLFLVALLGLPLALGGCSGDDGDTGPQGPPGPPGAGATTNESCQVCHQTGAIADVTSTNPLTAVHGGLVAPVELSATIDSFTVNPGAAAGSMFATTVFTVTDPTTGLPVTGLTTGSYVRIAYAQLRPGDPANTDTLTGTHDAFWTALTRSDRGPTNLTLINATTGTYQYVSTTDIGTTSTLTYPYDPQYQTRVLLILQRSGGPLVVDDLNVTNDFVGTNGVIISREIVTDDACNACHDRLGSPLSGNSFNVPDFHSGNRYKVDGCVVCHTQELGDAMANGTGEAEFGPMVHKIHNAPGSSEHPVPPAVPFIGLFDPVDAAAVTYPQDIRNCTTCHQGGAQSDDYKTYQVSAECFLSCHNTTVVTAFNHLTNVVPGNAPCANCHGPTAPAMIAPALNNLIPVYHMVFAQEESKKFQYNIDTSVNATKYSAATGILSVVYSVTNPNIAAGNPGHFYVLNGASADFAWAQTASGASRLFIDVGYPPQEISNANLDVAQPVSVNALTGTSNGNGTYTLNIPLTVPSGITAVVMGLEGHPAATNPATNAVERIPVKGETQNFSLDGSAVTAYQPVVDIAKCKLCHYQLSLHGSNRTDNINLCLICHNGNATDVERRLSANPPVNAGNLGPDGLTQQAIDFKVMIHGIHQASGITIYGFSSTPNTFDDVTFPGILSDCTMCHINTPSPTYGVPLPGVVLNTTTDVGANFSDASDNLRTTKTTSICSSCHYGSQSVNHMLIEGGKQGLTQQQIDNLQ